MVWASQARIWLISIQISIENNRKLVWDSPRQNLLDFYSHFNWKWKAIGLGQPKTESDWFLFKFQLKITGNPSGTAKDRIWLISIQIAIGNQRRLGWHSSGQICLISIQIWIENERKLVWDSRGQNLIDFYSNFNWK